jgi:hypothetical protein
MIEMTEIFIVCYVVTEPLNTDDTVILEDSTLADVEAEGSGTEEQESNWETRWQDSELTRKIRSGLEARPGQNAWLYVPIKKLPAFMRRVGSFTPRHWQFGLHSRDHRASSSETEVLKISLAAACKVNPVEWDDFCDGVVENTADVILNSYGIDFDVTKFNHKEAMYLLTLDALTLVLILCSSSRAPYSVPDEVSKHWLPNFFIASLVVGGFNIELLVRYREAILDDIFLCENQIPMALMKNVISKLYKLLPEELRYNLQVLYLNSELGELENPDSNVTKKLLDAILKIVTFTACGKFFAEPFSDKKYLDNLYDVNYGVDKFENCAHIFACIHKVMTTSVEKPSVAVTTKFGRVKQAFVRAVAPGSKQVASLIATTFGLRRRIVTGRSLNFESLQSATVLKKAGLQIKGIPGMVQEVAFKNGCLFLPIMLQSGNLQSYICNMAAYEYLNSSPPFPFLNYLLLMTQLIKTPEDVSYLVDCGVIGTYFGTHQRVLQVWETLHVVFPPYSKEYSDYIVKPINRHCASTLNVMVTDFYNRFCSKPWLVISVIVASILLVATLVQTYILVIGSDKMQPHFPRGG